MDIKESMAIPSAVDTGNKDIQQRVVSKTIKLGMFTTNQNAVWGGRQALMKVSFPFGLISFPANRKAFKYEVGDVFKWRYSKYGIDYMVCRVIQKQEESVESERIMVYAMEDIYSVVNGYSKYTGWTDYTQPPIDYTVFPFEHQMVMEVPFIMTYINGGVIYLLCLACRRSSVDLGFEVYMSMDGGASYQYQTKVPNIRPYGALYEAYPANTYPIDSSTTGMVVEFENSDVDQIQSVTWPEVLNGDKNTALLISATKREFISFQNITPITGYRYRLTNVIRGRWGSKREDHAIGTGFYFVPKTTIMVLLGENLAGASRKFKYVPYNSRQKGNISDSPVLSLNLTGEASAPYTPSNFEANGSSAFARYDTDVVLTWSPRFKWGGAGQGIPGEVLAETQREGYFSIEVWVGGVLKRTATGIDGVTWTYTESMSLSDNGALPDSVTFKISNYVTLGGIVYESGQAEVTCLKNIGGVS